MLNLHCTNNDKKKKKKIKVMRSPRFEPRIYASKDNRGNHYAMEANELLDKNNQYMLKL